jgi:hypothetical protein
MGRRRKPKDLEEQKQGPGVKDVAEVQRAVNNPGAPNIEALQKQLEMQQQQIALLTAVLTQNGGISATQEKEIVNNGWRVMYNPKHKNPDNRDWNPELGGRRADPNNPNVDVPRDLHVGDGKYEWGYTDPKTGVVKWSGKLLGSDPKGPPEQPPKSIEELREELAYS